MLYIFSISGNYIENAYSWSHLGHILSANVRDDDDKLARRNSLVGWGVYPPRPMTHAFPPSCFSLHAVPFRYPRRPRRVQFIPSDSVSPWQVWWRGVSRFHYWQLLLSTLNTSHISRGVNLFGILEGDTICGVYRDDRSSSDRAWPKAVLGVGSGGDQPLPQRGSGGVTPETIWNSTLL